MKVWFNGQDSTVRMFTIFGSVPIINHSRLDHSLPCSLPRKIPDLLIAGTRAKRLLFVGEYTRLVTVEMHPVHSWPWFLPVICMFKLLGTSGITEREALNPPWWQFGVQVDLPSDRGKSHRPSLAPAVFAFFNQI